MMNSRGGWPGGERTMADDLRDEPRKVDTKPHIHFHQHGGERHSHEHVHGAPSAGFTPHEHSSLNLADEPR